MDFAPHAIAEARQSFPGYEFRPTEAGEIGDQFDVVITSNCLEHFADPLSVMRRHLQSCRQFYVILVPYREALPLHPSHVLRFDQDFFPKILDGFIRLASPDRLRIALLAGTAVAGHLRVTLRTWKGGSASPAGRSNRDSKRRGAEACAQGAELAVQTQRLCEVQALAEGRKAELDAITASRAWALIRALRALRQRLAPCGSRRESAARRLWRATGPLRRPRAAATWLPRAAFRRLPLRFQYRIRGALAAAGGWRRRPWPALGGPVEPAEVRGLVSVVLPVYNHASLLRGAVESVLGQTYRNLELIIVNDGSTDGVEKVLADYVGDPRVRVLTQANQTLPAALSNGFEFARGEFWTWTSADNLMGPDQLRRQVAFLRAHEDVAMVYADYTAMDARGRPLRDASFRPHNRRAPDDPEIHLPDAGAFGQNADNFLGPCFLYRSWAGRLLGEYDPVQGIEDFDYWLRLSLVGRIAHLDTDEPLYQYRVHQNSLSGRAEELRIAEHARDLMGRHRARAEFAAKPWTIYADAATLAWLDQIDPAPHRVVRWSGEPLDGDAGEKRLLLVHADSLPAAVASPRLQSGGVSTAQPVLAAWFPGDAFAPDRYRAESNGAADVCFTDDDLTAARLAMLTPHVFRARPARRCSTSPLVGPTSGRSTAAPARRRTGIARCHRSFAVRANPPACCSRPTTSPRGAWSRSCSTWPSVSGLNSSTSRCWCSANKARTRRRCGKPASRCSPCPPRTAPSTTAGS